jgi:hypothetical protein
MKNIEDLVVQHLQLNSNYSLLITGKWGVGKTYFLKNRLIKSIEATRHSSTVKLFKVLPISLFGIKSVDEIQRGIFVSIYPLLKEKKVNIARSVINTILSRFIPSTAYDELLNVLIKSTIEDTAENKKYQFVICFDDLERISPNFAMSEYIGFVNNLVENYNFKIIIIANESEIEDKKAFQKFKEKVIGNTIEFIPEISEIFDDILKSRFTDSANTYDFIRLNKEYIINCFQNQSENLRILIFALDYIKFIFAKLNVEIENESTLTKEKDEIFRILIKFILAISIEYKLTRISYHRRYELDKLPDISMFLLERNMNPTSAPIDIEKDKPYKITFLETYYRDESFYFFPSVYDYLTGGKSFQVFELINELKGVFHIEDNIILEHYATLGKLDNRYYLQLSDEEYLRQTECLYEYARKGIYDQLSDYFRIFIYILRFNNPLRISPEKFIEEIVHSIRLDIMKFAYDDRLDMVLRVDNSYQHKESLIKLRDALLEINTELFYREEELDMIAYQETFYTDFEKFNSIYYTTSDLLNRPVFKYFDPDRFISFLVKSDAETKFQISNLLRQRYEGTSPSILIKEVEFLQIILKTISVKKEMHNSTNISGYIYDILYETLTNSISRIKRNS